MKHYEIVYELGVDNNGVVTTWEARARGVSTSELSRFCRDGRLEHVGYGVYRLTHYVPTPYTPYAEAVALVGPGAYLYGESVIAMFNLAPTNPRRLYVATTERVRRTLEPGLYVVSRGDECEVTDYEGVRCQDVYEAIVSLRHVMLPERIANAASRAHEQGLISSQKYKHIIEMLEGDIIAL